MIVIAESLQGAERRCRAHCIAMTGPDDDRARLNLFQLAAAWTWIERAPALAAGRADQAGVQCDGADPRVDGAHGAHGHSADFDLMFAGSIGERIGAAHSAAPSRTTRSRPASRWALRPRRRAGAQPRRRSPPAARGPSADIGPEDGTPHLVLGAVDAMPPAADKCPQRCQGRMGAWRGDRSPVRDDGAVGECNRRFRGSVSGWQASRLVFSRSRTRLPSIWIGGHGTSP
jgi:hypothetical protein